MIAGIVNKMYFFKEEFITIVYIRNVYAMNKLIRKFMEEAGLNHIIKNIMDTNNPFIFKNEKLARGHFYIAPDYE